MESVKEKRRRIRERDEVLGDGLVDEGHHMARVLDRIADAIIPHTISNDIQGNMSTPNSTPTILSESDPNSKVQDRMKLLENRTTAVEHAVAEVQADTKDILSLLREKLR